jgi:NAD(P)-dependent dehydrogenase (short-subunit alcohol dehydrogenase family)
MPGKIILVTGASSGFGKQAVSLLLARGHTVIAGVRGGEDRLRAVFSTELSRYSGALSAVDLHMERPETFEHAREYLERKHGGKLDVLINNAGAGLFGALEDQSPEQLRYQMEINFFGPTLLTRALLPVLRAARGRIINVSSLAGRIGLPFYGSYNASKFALEGLSEALAFELRPMGVQVSLIEPGGFKTEFMAVKKMADGGQNASSPYHRRSVNFEKSMERINFRLADPARVARLMVRLCEKRRIPLRVPIGVDSVLGTWMYWLLPGTWARALMYLGYRVAVFKD